MQDASRLVFVSLKNAKPRRKVAIPIPNIYTWEQFCQQVQNKLKLRGVERVILASSGEHVTSLDELQDIDELYVEEGPAPPPPTMNGGFSDRATSGSRATSSSAYTNISPDQVSPKNRIPKTDIVPMEADARRGAADEEQKYAKKPGGVKRSLQRVLPALFSPTLPVTTRDVQEEGKSGRGRRRRRRASLLAFANLLKFFGVVVFVLFLLFVYTLMVPRME